MKFRWAFALVVICAESLSAQVVFQGYMTTSEGSLFVLSVDKDRTSGWLTVGQKFEGVSIISFDRKSELLTVESAGKQQAIPLVDGKTRAAKDGPNQVTTKPIVILIGKNESISVGDDVAMLEALKKKFELVAAMDPRPTITFRPPADATFGRLRLVMDLCTKAGITRFDIKSQ